MNNVLMFSVHLEATGLPWLERDKYRVAWNLGAK